MKLLLILFTLIFFTGCGDFFNSFEDKAAQRDTQKKEFLEHIQQTKEVQLKKLSEETQRKLAELKSKKELALIKKEQELEKIRMKAEIEKQKIVFEKEKQEALFEQKMKQQEQSYAMELKRYLSITLALFLFLVSYFVFYYFKKRREDKLRAYNDNLSKYFHHKENEARVKIAEKMLDAISSGTLDKEQENQLIRAFSGQASQENNQEQLPKENHEMIEDKTEIKKDENVIELIEQK
jgi:hypothetical protein